MRRLLLPAIGAACGQGHPASVPDPAYMHVDYVRAFQCSDWTRCGS